MEGGGGGVAGSFYHMNEVSAYLVRQREGPWQKEHISHTCSLF